MKNGYNSKNFNKIIDNLISILEDTINSIISIYRINDDESYHEGEISWPAPGERYLIYCL